jgi:hypothetical protein
MHDPVMIWCIQGAVFGTIYTYSCKKKFHVSLYVERYRGVADKVEHNWLLIYYGKTLHPVPRLYGD